MKEIINPLTVEKRNRENFFHAFCRRILKMANKHLEKRHNIKILLLWDI